MPDKNADEQAFKLIVLALISAICLGVWWFWPDIMFLIYGFRRR